MDRYAPGSPNQDVVVENGGDSCLNHTLSRHDGEQYQDGNNRSKGHGYKRSATHRSIPG